MPVLEANTLICRITLGASIALVVGVFTGCHRVAYNDLYTESMAGEIRELENRIYEYDSAYQSIEQELTILESENAELHSRLMQMETNPASKRSGGSSLLGETTWRDSNSSLRNQDMGGPPPIQLVPQEIPSVDNLPAPKQSSSAQPKLAPLKDAPAASKSSTPPPIKANSKTDSSELVPPMIELGTPANGVGGSVLPPTSEPLPKMSVPPSFSTPPAPGASGIPSPFMPPPTTGSSREPLPKDKMVAESNEDLPSMRDQLKPSESRIELPEAIAKASFQSPKTATINPKIDKKIVEIGFHPSLCRGQNLDDEEGDDGLYIVLQPRNQASEIVDEPAAVTIVAMDPQRPEAEARIGRWVITNEELESSLEPIGMAHGYHLSLPWQNDIEPLGDMVQVYVRYEMKDGRRLINERRVQLHRVTAGSNVWTPRGKAN